MSQWCPNLSVYPVGLFLFFSFFDNQTHCNLMRLSSYWITMMDLRICIRICIRNKSLFTLLDSPSYSPRKYCLFFIFYILNSKFYSSHRNLTGDFWYNMYIFKGGVRVKRFPNPPAPAWDDSHIDHNFGVESRPTPPFSKF